MSCIKSNDPMVRCMKCASCFAGYCRAASVTLILNHRKKCNDENESTVCSKMLSVDFLKVEKDFC